MVGVIENRKEVTDPLVLLGKQLLGRYTIRDRIAQGGMSVIYRGQDERLQRPVCVKVFFGLDGSTIAHQTGYEHFVQEAFALSQLKHPNTIRIYDFGYLDVDPHSPFHVSELMDGGTLRQCVQSQGPLSLPAALEILEPLVGALTEAHSRGIVHRDIKPANILFGSAGPRRIVKLADFGIAKAHVDELNRAIPNRAQDTRAIAGRRISLYSPGWAAPEQLRGKPVGPPADVFALGLVTAFMLSGKKLFPDEDFHRLLGDRAKGDEYVEMALHKLDLPQDVVAVLRHACRVNPVDRCQTVEDFIKELRTSTEKRRDGETHSGADTHLTSRTDTSPTHLTKAESPPIGLSSMPMEDRMGNQAVPMHAAAMNTSPIEEGECIVARLGTGQTVVANRRVRFLAADDRVDLDSVREPSGKRDSHVRFRLTLLPEANGRLRLHVKGLNCFVSRPGARATNGVDIDADTPLEIMSAGRDSFDRVLCVFGRVDQDMRLFSLGAGAGTLAVPLEDAQRAVLLDFGPGRDLVLVYRSSHVMKGGS